MINYTLKVSPETLKRFKKQCPEVVNYIKKEGRGNVITVSDLEHLGIHYIYKEPMTEAEPKTTVRYVCNDNFQISYMYELKKMMFKNVAHKSYYLKSENTQNGYAEIVLPEFVMEFVRSDKEKKLYPADHRFLIK